MVDFGSNGTHTHTHTQRGNGVLFQSLAVTVSYKKVKKVFHTIHSIPNKLWTYPLPLFPIPNAKARNSFVSC